MIVHAPPRLLTPDRRRAQAITAGVLALGCLGARMLNPDHPLPIDVCLFKRLTGLPCPTCGLTRAFCHALRGDWAASLAYHPAGILLAAGVIGGALWLTAEAVRGAPWRDDLRHRMFSRLVTLGIALSVTNWVVFLVGRAAP